MKIHQLDQHMSSFFDKHIFLSYSHEDREMMWYVRDTLQEDDNVVWTDDNLDAGTPVWQNAVGEAIEQARAVVVLLSRTAKTSKWVNREISYAQTHGIRIFPAHIKNTVQEAIPFSLIDHQRVDLRDVDDREAEMNDLLQSLRNYRPEPISEHVHPNNELSDRQQQRFEFWTQLLAQMRNINLSVFQETLPSAHYFISSGAGRPGFSLEFVIRVRDAAVRLRIELGSEERSEAYLHALQARQEEIELDFGEPLEWLPLEDRSHSQIVKTYTQYGNLDMPDRWQELQDALIDAMVRLDQALRPRIRELDL